MNRITFKKAPSVSRVQDALGRLARHEHFGERLTGEEAHKIAAVFFAANWAMRRDVLPASWKGSRHTAAKCGELFDRVSRDPSYVQSNFQFEVEILFG